MTGGFRKGRTENTRSYKKLYLIASEGKKTEKSYFIKNICCLIDKENIAIKFIDTPDSAPCNVLAVFQDAIKKEDNHLRKGDEAWIVIDRDTWPEDAIREVYQWTQTRPNDKLHRDMALSNPCFEYWLLLHYEDGSNTSTVNDCKGRLKKHLTLINNNVPEGTFNREHVEQAIKRAKTIKEKTWGETQQPITAGHIGTTVYRLVEKLLES
jgi:hypothetical protein